MNGTRICSVEECERAHVARGLCKKHYGRAKYNQLLDAYPIKSPADRLRDWLRRMPNGCIEWTRSTTKFGYGQIAVEGHTTTTHRLAWKLANGPIPDGMHVLHHCDNPPCCNPEHLFVGTHADNMADRDKKGRCHAGEANLVKTHCPQGHEYTDENTYVRPRGGRTCRTCIRAFEKAKGPRNRSRKSSKPKEH